MSITPEVLPPERPGLSDAVLERLAAWLDDRFTIPGTEIRFGFDPLIGLMPGLGDLIGGVLSFVFVYAAWQRRVPRVTVARMLFNIGIDTLVGTVPLAGDIFDVAWKANRKNFKLLQRSQAAGRTSAWRDWVWLALMMLAVAAIVLAPFVVLYLILHVLWPRVVLLGW